MIDYAEDQRIGKEILQTTADAYRKLRNTVRYLLGALAGFTEAERLPPERDAAAGALHAAPPVPSSTREVRAAYEGYDFQDVYARCPSSADATCRPSTSTSAGTPSTATPATACAPRRAHGDGRGVRALTIWLAPDPPSPWRRPGRPASPTTARPPARLPDDAGRLAQRRRGRALGQGAARAPRGHRRLEVERREKRIGSASRPRPRSTSPTPSCGRLRRPRLRRGLATPAARAAGGARPRRAPSACPTCPAWRSSRPRPTGRKCARCWRVLPEVGPETRRELCHRCEDALGRVAAE